MDLTAEEARNLSEDIWGTRLADYRSTVYAVIRDRARHKDDERRVRLPSPPDRHIGELVKQELRDKGYDVSPRGVVTW